MKKRIITYLFGLSLFSPMIGFCEDYLFPTDVLPKGQFDIRAGVSNTEYSEKVGTDVFGPPVRGERLTKITTEEVQVRYGLGADSQIGVTVPYESQREFKYKTSPGSFLNFTNKPREADGVDNIGISFRHRFIGGDESQFSLVGNAKLYANTAERNYTGLALGLSAGWVYDDSLKAHLGYSYFVSDQDNLSSSHRIEAGLYKQITSLITLIPEYSFTHFDKSSDGSFTTATPTNAQSFGVAAHIQVSPRSYLIPYAGLNFHEKFHNDAAFNYGSSNDGKTLSLSFYHAFEPIR